MRRQFHLSAVILAAFFFILCTFPKEVQAVFMDEKTFSADLSLQLGTLSMTLENQSTTSQSFAHIGENQVHNVKVKNTGTLDGKLTYSIISAKLGDQVLSEAQIAQYLAIDSPTQKEFIKSGEERTLQFSIKQMKQWDSTQPLIVEVKVTISQANTDSDTIGFLDSDNLQFSFKSASEAVPISSWPENLTFNQAGYAIGQQMYYSTVDNKYTTVVPGIIFIKYKNNQMISLNEQDETKTKLKNAIHSVQSGNFNYVFKSIEYIPQEGFKLQLGIENSVVDAKFTVAGIKFDYIDNHLTYNQFNDFCKPLIVESDVNRTNTYTNNPLYSSTLGTNYQMFSNEQTNTFSYGLTSAEIGNYVSENFDVEFTGTDAKKFEVSFLKNSMIHLKQLDTEGGKKAQLIFKDKMTKQIVFSREVISVDQEEFSDIDLSNLISNFQTTVVNKTAKRQANSFNVSTDFYMKIPENFLSHYYLQPFSNSSMSRFSVSYSPKMDYVKISFDYSYTNQPDTIEQMIVFLGYQFGFGSTTSEKSYTLYKRTDYASSSASSSTDSIQMQQKSNAKSASGISEDIEDTHGSQQNSTQESDEKEVDPENDTDVSDSDSMTENQSDVSTTVTNESSELATNQTEPSQEPE